MHRTLRTLAVEFGGVAQLSLLATLLPWVCAVANTGEGHAPLLSSWLGIKASDSAHCWHPPQPRLPVATLTWRLKGQQLDRATWPGPRTHHCQQLARRLALKSEEVTCSLEGLSDPQGDLQVRGRTQQPLPTKLLKITFLPLKSKTTLEYQQKKLMRGYHTARELHYTLEVEP